MHDTTAILQVMNETLRRATILPWYSRKAAQDFTIDGNVYGHQLAN
jgi:cytochrome P450